MRVAVGGSTGLIGSALTQHLRRTGHEVVRLVRREPHSPDERRWHLSEQRREIEGGLADVDAVVNLAGAGIANARWTRSRKRELVDSRLRPTQTIAAALAEAPRCRTFLSGSAIGVYGDRGPEQLDEQSSAGHGFLADLVRDWEAAAVELSPTDTRVVLLRTGHVLAGQGGILGKQKLIYELGLGGPIGDGGQWVSWISLADHVAAMTHLLTRDDLCGPVNMVGPNPVTNLEFTRAFARAMHRPAKLPLPLPVARAVFTSEMVDDAMLASQRVRPKVLIESGFDFGHRTVNDAMRAALD
ncbi:TIGR01777 family oxidoreductase [Aestuariimicrobium ganziense]|uniref:TIGR01777 family oxidoreductase n=1 Tax=Aestuariimicrobium ganziense TaxID=2773677 RepID=UPI00194104DF|nr:TIGR01777 family oxidoreductase [Aestuariimicrobium ganziense]